MNLSACKRHNNLKIFSMNLQNFALDKLARNFRIFYVFIFLIYGQKRITRQQALALHACISAKFLTYASAMDGIRIYRILAIVSICVILTRRLSSRSHVSVSVLYHICIIYMMYIRAKYVQKKYIRILL